MRDMHHRRDTRDIVAHLDSTRTKIAPFRVQSGIRAVLPPQTWWAEPNVRTALIALLVSGAYYVGALIGFSVRFHSSPISPIWPPNAILLVALLVVPVRMWWVCLLAVCGAHLLVELPNGVPLVTASGLYVTNTGEALLGAFCVRSFIGRPPWLGGLRRLAIYLICAVVVAPIVTSFADAAVVALTRWGDNYYNYWLNWRMRCVSNSMAELTIGPALLLGLTRTRAWIWEATRYRCAEAALLAGGLLLVGVSVFTGRITWGGANPGLLYAVLPFLLWAAIRFGIGGTSASLLGITVLSTWGAVLGRGPFSASSPADNVVSLQLFLIGISMPMLFLAALIQERDQAEATLQESEERYRDLVESQMEMICRYRPDTTLTFVNAAFCRYYRRSPEALVGKKFLDLLDKPAREHHIGYIATLLAQPHTVVDEHEVLLPDGSIGWQQWVDHPICNAWGQLVEFQSVGRDITERKRAEQALRESEERYRAVVSNFPHGVVLLFGEDSRHLFADGQGLPEMGLSKESVEGKTIWEAFPADIAAVLDPYYCGALAGHSVSCDLEHNQHTYHLQVVPIHYASARAGMVVMQDVTEQRRARDELERERTQAAFYSALSQEFRTLLDHSPDVITRFDRALRLLYVNPRGATTLGIPVSERFGKTYAELGLPESVYRPWEQALQKVIATGEPRAFETQLQMPGRPTLHLHVRYIPEFAPDGSVESVLGITSDITELKQAEARVAEQASQLEAIVQSMTDGLVVWDVHGNILRRNSASERIFGFAEHDGFFAHSLEERARLIEARDEQGQALAPDQLPPRRLLRGDLLTGPNAVGLRVRARDGHERHLSLAGGPLRDASGQIIGTVGVFRDVTALKQAEEALRQSEERFSKAFHANPVAMTITSRTSGQILDANEAAFQLSGYSRDEILGGTVPKLGIVGPTELHDLRVLLRRYTQVYNAPIRVQTKSGELRFCLLSTESIRLGSEECIITIIHDMTERMRVEEALRAAKAAAEAAKQEEEQRRHEAERREQIAGSLREVLTILNSNRSLTAILNFIARQAGHLLGSEAAAIYTTDGTAAGALSEGVGTTQAVLALQAAYGFRPPHPSTGGGERPLAGSRAALRSAMAKRRPVAVLGAPLAPPRHGGTIDGGTIDGGTTGQNGGNAFRDGDAVEAVDEAVADYLVLRQEPLPAPYRALLAVPIVAQDEVYGGLLLLYSEPHRFSIDEVALAMAYSDQVALAIANARLQDHIERAATETERNRLARELHDTVTQDIFSASLIAEAIPRIWEKHRAEAAHSLQQLHEITRGALAALRALLLELRPAMLEEQTIADLLRQLAEVMTVRSGVPITLTIADDCPAIPNAVKVALYRIAQEALMNAAKHSSAHQIDVRVRVRRAGEAIHVEVSDDGRGFAIGAVPTGHFGIGMMRERARAIGAALRIRSQLGQGTRIVVEWRGTIGQEDAIVGRGRPQQEELHGRPTR